MAEHPEKPSESTIKKKVDESWKSSVEQERESPSASAAEEGIPPANTDFPFFISTLGMQTLLALGEIADPATGEKKTSLPQAQYLIEIIRMLSDKTKGNLSKEEASMVQNLLYELQMKFVAKSQVV